MSEPSPKGFTARQAAKLAGFRTTYMLDYLCRTGIVQPTASPCAGRGRRRMYSFQDVVLLRGLARLLTRGLPVNRLKKALATLQKTVMRKPDSSFPVRFLATDGFRVFYPASNVSVVDLTANGQLAFAFLLDMHVLAEEVRHEAAKLSA
jgi:DNA-binding transcriptional MerR regulator